MRDRRQDGGRGQGFSEPSAVSHAIGHGRPGRRVAGLGHDVDQDAKRRRQRHAAAEQNAEVAREQRRAMKLHNGRNDGQSRNLGHNAGPHRRAAPRHPAADDGDGDDDADFQSVTAQDVRKREEHFDDRIGLGIEVAQHRRELRQHERDEEDQDAARGEIVDAEYRVIEPGERR